MSIDFTTLDQQRRLAERVKLALSEIDDKTGVLYTIIDALDTYVSGVNDKVDALSIPTKTSELTNDAKFQTDTDVATAIANVDKLTRKKIDSLTDIDLSADDAEDFIYMLGVTDTDGNTYYQQYMVINGAVEAMGTTKVDLEGYLTDSDVATDDDVDAEIDEGFDMTTFMMPICVNPNLFRNGTLLKPIDQRGKGIYTGIGYGFDGWYAYHPQTVVTKTAEGLDVTNSGSPENAVVGQIISTSDLIPGQYTLSALSTDGFLLVEVWSGSRKLLETPVDKFFSKQFYIDSTWPHSQIRFNFYMRPGSKFVGAKLERGDRQTAVYKDISGSYVWIECPIPEEELMRCYPHFFNLLHNVMHSQGYLGMCVSNNKTSAYGLLPLPCQLKGVPRLVSNVSVGKPGNMFGLFESGYADRAVIELLRVDTVSAAGISMQYVASGLKPGSVYQTYVKPPNEFDIWLSAELLPA